MSLHPPLSVNSFTLDLTTNELWSTANFQGTSSECSAFFVNYLKQNFQVASKGFKLWYIKIFLAYFIIILSIKNKNG